MRLIEPNNGIVLREAVSRLVDNTFTRQAQPTMPVDVMEEGDHLILKASLPGASKEKLEVHYEQNILTVKAEFVPESGPENARWLLRERNLSTVSRTFRLPYPIDAAASSAEFVDGVLTLTLPKLESAKPRQISIQ